jgi:hypothetical protein
LLLFQDVGSGCTIQSFGSQCSRGLLIDLCVLGPSPRREVVGGLRECHLGPPFPFGDGTCDLQRPGKRRGDSGAKPFVDLHPGVEQLSVLSALTHIAFDVRRGYRPFSEGRTGATLCFSPSRPAIARMASRDCTASPRARPSRGQRGPLTSRSNA